MSGQRARDLTFVLGLITSVGTSIVIGLKRNVGDVSSVR